MRFLLIFLFIGLASCSLFQPRKTTTNHGVRQMNLIKLLNHVHMVNADKEQVEISKSFDFMKNIDKFSNPQAVEEFFKMWRYGMLPRQKIFSITNEKQRMEAISLFHVLYYAKDFETFYRTACWARDHVNEGMFVYSFTVAVLHRSDCKEFFLPAPYEVYPYFFINTEVIDKAYKLKMQEKVIDPKLGEYYGITTSSNKFVIMSNYSGWYVSKNKEQKLTYFTEDVGLNSYYFYFHARYPFWMSGKQFMSHENHGEKFLFVHGQLLARYYMERLSNGLGEIPNFSWLNPIKTGFVSSLKYPNGIPFPSRPNYLNMRTNKNILKLNDVMDFERQIRDAVNKGFLIVDKTTIIDLKNPEDIEILGNMIRGNPDGPRSRFMKYMILLCKFLLGNSPQPHKTYQTVPSVLEQYQTALRDPMFWQMYKRFMHYVIRFKNFLKPYTSEQLTLPGVRIEDVQVDKLETFFQYFDVDITNSVWRNRAEFSRNTEDFIFYARQHRLNHKPFEMKFFVTCDATKDVVVRVFLGPKYDSMGHVIPFNDNRFNFLLLDQFFLTLTTGKNKIVRNSQEFNIGTKDMITTRDIEKHLEDTQFLTTMTYNFFKFPKRLILPRGRLGGMPYQFFVSIVPVTTKTERMARTTGWIDTGKYADGKEFMIKYAKGYPLDRWIDEATFFSVPNFFFKDVLIYHKSEKPGRLNPSFMGTVHHKHSYDSTSSSSESHEYDTYSKEKSYTKTYKNKYIKDHVSTEVH